MTARRRAFPVIADDEMEDEDDREWEDVDVAHWALKDD
jgi:hypothetical protein